MTKLYSEHQELHNLGSGFKIDSWASLAMAISMRVRIRCTSWPKHHYIYCAKHTNKFHNQDNVQLTEEPCFLAAANWELYVAPRTMVKLDMPLVELMRRLEIHHTDREDFSKKLEEFTYQEEV